MREVLEDAKVRGFLGPGPVEVHVRRSLELAGGLDRPAGRYLDLGSGGGVPGLPLAVAMPDARWSLLDGGTTRSDFLQEAVHRLGLGSRVDVVSQRAEAAGRGALRGSFDGVVARSFAPPAVTAECGAPLLRVGGILVVAEPPGRGREDRWDGAALDTLGLRPWRRAETGTAWRSFLQERLCPDRYPRRTGVPAKRPLF